MLAQVGHAVEVLAGRVRGRERRRALVEVEVAERALVCFGEADHGYRKLVLVWVLVWVLVQCGERKEQEAKGSACKQCIESCGYALAVNKDSVWSAQPVFARVHPQRFDAKTSVEF